ncbi:MAG TPA: methyltransferase domain-containing protein [Pseudonocardiaceae bacterium]|jgi:SAM-dependent methyltransferase|nr:methyltransferase domain-containing protein [Pseudonocardiaceae bacterium]
MAADEPVYTHGHHDSVLRSHRSRTVANSAAYLVPHLTAGASLLDVGCGPGTITVELAQRVAPGRVTAIDASEPVLAEARSLAAERGVTSVEFTTGDVHALDFPDNTFDLVHAHQVLQHVHDPVLALREMARVCRPGGVIAARDADYAAMTWYPEVPELTEWLALYRTVARSNRGEPDAGRRLVSWARSAGLTDLTATASAWCYATPAERDWWGGSWSDRIRESAIARQAVAEGVATEADLARLSAGWRTWAATEDGWFAVLHGEILARAY